MTGTESMMNGRAGSVVELDGIFEQWTEVEMAIDSYVHAYHSPDDSEPDLLREARDRLKDGKFSLLKHLIALREGRAE